jgi:RimJ/RimL family protein N-acetyltransferase
MDRAVRIVRCPVGWEPKALELLHRSLAPGERRRVVAGLLAEAGAGTLDLRDLWIVRDEARPVAVALGQGLGGGAAAVWPPQVDETAAGPRRDDLAALLVERLVLALTESGLRVIQALVPEADVAASADLERGGLPHVTSLEFLVRDARIPAPAPAERLAWEPWTDAGSTAFLEATAGSYTGSLDMPELDGCRSADDHLRGLRDQRPFDPSLWQLARVADCPIGVVLMSDDPERDALHLAYLGLVSAWRGRGLGHALVARALEIARGRRGRLETAVDERNAPARRVYAASGFALFDRRAVHLRVVGP